MMFLYQKIIFAKVKKNMDENVTTEQAFIEIENAIDSLKESITLLKAVVAREQPEEFQNQSLTQKQLNRLLAQSDIRL